MQMKHFYTAVGRFERRTNACGQSCPIIILGGKEYMVDLQEMVVWTCLNWRIVKKDAIAILYDKACQGNVLVSERSLDYCIDRLLTRGLLVSGVGASDYEALYDLLSSLYIIPANGSMPLRLFTFCKLVLLDRIPIAAAKKLLAKDKRTTREQQVMQLANQALLSSAEIIKCLEKDIKYLPDEESILDKLYDDTDTTSENISYLVKTAPCSKAVIIAIANLYLRQQIIFERM